MDDSEKVICYVDDHGEVTYGQIRAARAGVDYPFTLANHDEIGAVIAAVNQGIDAHLEACFAQGEDSYEVENYPAGRRLVCSLTPKSLPVLLRRLESLNHRVGSIPGLSNRMAAAGEDLAWRIIDDVLMHPHGEVPDE